MDDNRKTVDSVGSGRGAIGERGGYSGVDQSDDSTSSSVSGREMHRVGCENLLKRGEVVVRRSTNILGTDNIVSLKQRLKMRNDFIVASNQTTREREAARIDVRSDNRGEPKRRSGIGSSVWVG